MVTYSALLTRATFICQSRCRIMNPLLLPDISPTSDVFDTISQSTPELTVPHTIPIASDSEVETLFGRHGDTLSLLAAR
jgi:hypothetical protein